MDDRDHLAELWCQINAYDLVGPSEVMKAIEQIVGLKACTDRWEQAHREKRKMVEAYHD